MRWIMLAVLLAGCATTGGLRQEPLDVGAQRLFRYPSDKVSEAAQAALRKSGFEVKEVAEVREGVWTIMATKGMSLMSYGELVRISLSADGTDKTVARFITKKRMATNVAAKGDWSTSIYEDMQGMLEGRIPHEKQTTPRRRGPR